MINILIPEQNDGILLTISLNCETNFPDIHSS